MYNSSPNLLYCNYRYAGSYWFFVHKSYDRFAAEYTECTNLR